MPTVMQWTNHLQKKIEEQQAYARQYEARYRNEWVLPFIEREYRDVYGDDRVDALAGQLRAPRTGTAAIGIDALTERLTVQGVDSDDKRLERKLQDAFEDNDLLVMHREAHREAFIKARSFGSVHRADDGRAVVGIESAEQMAVHRQAGPPYDVDASLKVSTDEWTGKQLGLLRLPGRDLNLIQLSVALEDPEGSTATSRWTVADERQTRLPMPPVAEFASRGRLLVEPSSEIEPIVTAVDICDLVEGLMVFAGHFGAVPIRFGTGLTIPRDPKDNTKPLLGPDGKPVMAFKARADRFWTDTNPAANFGQLSPAGLAEFVAWAEHASSRVRAQTSVASTYYSIDLKSHMSAELLKTDEAPMVRRVLSMGRDGSFGTSWRRIFRFMQWIEEPLSTARVRSRWADPNTRVEAAAVDSFQKAVASGLGIQVAAQHFLGWDAELAQRAVDEAAQARRDVAQLGDPTLERIARNLLPTPDALAA